MEGAGCEEGGWSQVTGMPRGCAGRKDRRLGWDQDQAARQWEIARCILSEPGRAERGWGSLQAGETQLVLEGVGLQPPPTSGFKAISLLLK